MNKYKVRTRNVYDMEVSVFYVEADTFFADRHSVTFALKGEAVAFYDDVISVEKIKDE